MIFWPRPGGGWLKDIESRTHDRFAGLVERTVAIHASRTFDRAAAAEIARYLPREILDAPANASGGSLRHALRSPDGWPRGKVIGVCRVVAHRRLTAADAPQVLCGCDGLWGLVLGERRRIVSPQGGVPAKGHQGIWYWTPPEGVEFGPVSAAAGALRSAAAGRDGWWHD
jgi:hypothetical protein